MNLFKVISLSLASMALFSIADSQTAFGQQMYRDRDRDRDRIERDRDDRGNYGRAYINVSPNPCYANGRDVCVARIQWDSGGRNGVVTVTSRNEGREKVFACGASGSGRAPWIVPGDSYVFRVYRGANCSFYGSPVAQDTVQGRP